MPGDGTSHAEAGIVERTTLAVVVGPRFDVLVCNRAVAELLDGVRNLLRRIFAGASGEVPVALVPIEPVVDVLRRRVARCPGDGGLHRLIGSSMLRSEPFKARWAEPAAGSPTDRTPFAWAPTTG